MQEIERKKTNHYLWQLKLEGMGIESGLWGDGQLFPLFTNCTVED